MSYGIHIPNIFSETILPDVYHSARLVHILECRAWSGTATIPVFNSSEGYFYCQNLAGSDPNNVSYGWSIPKCVFDNNTKVFTWTVGGTGNINLYTWSNNFNVLFFKTVV
jgi:hypothetical protein